MNVLVLSVFAIGPFVVAYWLVKRQERLERLVQVFNDRGPIFRPRRK